MNDVTNVKEVSKAHFDAIASSYDTSYDGKFVSKMYQDLVQRVNALSPAPLHILDLGCGNGNVLAILSKTTKASLYGLDLSEEMVEVAQQRLPEVNFCVGDAEALPYAAHQFDVIICNASFHHYPNPLKVLMEIKRVLKKGGTFILGDPTGPSLWLKLLNFGLRYSNSGDYHIYTKKEISALLEKVGFNISNYKNTTLKTFALNATY